jgi:hypothetical protein
MNSDKQLYYTAMMAKRSGNLLDVARYLTAYIERDPVLYRTNNSHHKQVDDNLSYAIREINDDIRISNEAEHCGAEDTIGDCVSFTRAAVSSSSLVLTALPGEAIFFVDFNFGGRWVALPLGNYMNAQEINLPNDSISSFIAGPGVRVYMCMHGGLTDPCEMMSGDDKNLGDNYIGNDQVTSLRVELNQDCKPGPNQVALFMHYNFTPPCEIKNIGKYDSAQALGLPNDSISSVKVGQNVRLVLCMHGSQTEPCEIFMNDDPNLGDNYIGNDQVTSARVESR